MYYTTGESESCLDRDGDPTGYGETLPGVTLRVRGEAFAPVGRD